MRVAVFNGPGKPITIEDVPDDPLGTGDVRLEVGRCGICGSDITMTSGSAFDFPTGFRLGHESAGTVIEVGPGVSTLKVGDRVSVLPNGYCGECQSCREGRPLFCTSARAQFGGFGERLVIRERTGFKFPDSVSMAEGALVEPIACGRRAFRMSCLQKGESVLVLGAGSMGLAAIYWARQMGAGKIVVATRTTARHEISLAMGADAAVTISENGIEGLEEVLPVPPDVVVEATGKPGALHRAVETVRVGGSVVSMGMCVVADPIVPAFNGFREVSMHFPVAYSQEDFVETVRAFDKGSIRPEVMVTETVDLTDLPALIDEMRGPHSHLKAQIVPD